MDQNSEVLPPIIRDKLAQLAQPHEATRDCGALIQTLPAGDFPLHIDHAYVPNARARLTNGFENLPFHLG